MLDSYAGEMVRRVGGIDRWFNAEVVLLEHGEGDEQLEAASVASTWTQKRHSEAVDSAIPSPTLLVRLFLQVMLAAAATLDSWASTFN